MPAPQPDPRMRPGIQHPERYSELINFYNAIARKLLTFKDRRMEMAEILLRSIPECQRYNDFQVYKGDRISKKDLAVTYIQNPKWINPFHFFVFFNAYLPDQNRNHYEDGNREGNWRNWLKNLHDELAFDNELQMPPQMPYKDVHYPGPYLGNNAHYFDVLDGWMQNYYQLTEEKTVDRLWRLAEYATNFLPPEPNTKEPSQRQFIEDFNHVAPMMRTIPLLSAGLNWMNPGVWIRARYSEYRRYYSVFFS